MPSKKLSTRANAYLGVLTLLVLIAAIGVISEQFLHRRLDLTRDREFTLSSAALKTLDGLPDRITIRAVISKDLPSQFMPIRTRVEDLLQEFQARSNGKLNVVYEDPGADPQKQQEAMSLGVQQVQLQEQSEGDMQIKKGFFGLALVYGDKKEVIPVIQDVETFEYDLVVKLKKLTGSSKTLGVIEGSPGSQFTFTLPGAEGKTNVGFEQNFTDLKQEIEKLYKVETPDLAAGPIPDDIDLLFIAAPTHLSELEKFRIDQYLMKGKSAIFLTPGIDIDLTSLRGQPTQNGYEDLLARYGLGVRKNVVLEPQHWQLVRFGNSFFPTPYPYWINVDYTTMSASSPITAKLQAISLPWTSSVEIDTTLQDSSDVQVLARTTPGSWEETDGFYFVPKDLQEYVPIAPRSFPLAVLKTAKFKSLYADRLPPSDSAHPIDTAQVLKVAQGKASVLVISNALFATDFYVGYTGATPNLMLILNAIDQLALDPDLINIRSRTLDEAAIDETKKNSARLPVTLVNMALAPVLLLLIGIIIGVRRRNRENSGEART